MFKYATERRGAFSEYSLEKCPKFYRLKNNVFGGRPFFYRRRAFGCGAVCSNRQDSTAGSDEGISRGMDCHRKQHRLALKTRLDLRAATEGATRDHRTRRPTQAKRPHLPGTPRLRCPVHLATGTVVGVSHRENGQGTEVGLGSTGICHQRGA